MSIKQCVGEIIEGYANGHVLHKKCRQQQQKTILKIRSISGDIQDLERSIKKGTIACKVVGIASGFMTMAGILGAPFTFGGSLSLTAVGTGIGICSGAVDMIQSWVKSSDIESKCNEASTLLKVSSNLTAELLDQAKKMHEVQKKLCIALKTGNITLKAVGCACGMAVADLLLRNIPNIEQSSRALIVIFESPGTTLCFMEATVISTGNVAAPVASKVASRIAKKSIRVIGAAAVGIAIIADVVQIVNNADALDQRKLSDIVTRLKDAANEMEKEMKEIDEVFATPSSVQNTLIKKL